MRAVMLVAVLWMPLVVAGPLESPVLESSAVIHRLAFGSCFKAQREGDGIWSALEAWAPQLFLFAGDTLYPDEDDVTSDLPELRAAYDLLERNAPFAAFRERVPVWPVWDDHDYGRNDAGGDFPFREQSQRLFLERWGIGEGDPRRERSGLYHSAIYGEQDRTVQVLVLDTRFFRSPLAKTDEYGARGKERYQPDPDLGKTLLGEAQWRWLEQELSREADLRILVSSIQVLADGHGWEGWRNLPRERERLLGLLSHVASPVLILSGDRHVAGFYALQIGPGKTLYEFTSSALNNPISIPNRYNTLAEDGPNRLGTLFGESNFGGIVIDWEERTLTLELRDAQGELKRREVLSMEASLQRVAPQDL